MSTKKKYSAIVIGTSAGGFFALSSILQVLPSQYPVPILIVQHRAKDSRKLLEELLQIKCKVSIKQADEKELIEKGRVYIAPPDYHLLVERDKTLSLSSDKQVQYSRPSINVLFESAAMVYKELLVGIILTGASMDGAAGIEAINKYDGLTIAQSPAEAAFPVMPKAAIETGNIQLVLTLSQIQQLLLTI